MKPVAWYDPACNDDEMAFSFTGGFDRHVAVFTADQLRQAKVEILREAARTWANTNKLDSPLHFLTRMADELENGNDRQGTA